MVEQLIQIGHLEQEKMPPLDITLYRMNPLIVRGLIEPKDYVNATGKRIVCAFLTEAAKEFLEYLIINGNLQGPMNEVYKYPK